MRIVALLYYILTGMAVIAFIGGVFMDGEVNFNTLERFLWVLGAVTAGAVMHGLGDACFALRDIARNTRR